VVEGSATQEVTEAKPEGLAPAAVQVAGAVVMVGDQGDKEIQFSRRSRC
jgi:hypothetical protein